MTVYTYPVALDLTDRPCLVVGRGSLAAEKVEGLLRARAHVMWVLGDGVVACRPDLARECRCVQKRPYRSSDMDGMYLAYGADADRGLNALVARDARAGGVIVNAVDDIPNCDFFAMAMVRRDDLQVAISTNGRSPAFARWLREQLERDIPPVFGEVLDAMASARDEVRAHGETPSYAAWAGAISAEVQARGAGGGPEGAMERAIRLLRRAVTIGVAREEVPA